MTQVQVEIETGKFDLVVFDDGAAIIPHIWKVTNASDTDTLHYFYPQCSFAGLKSMILSCSPPDFAWDSFECLLIASSGM